ncbi:MAG: UDP-N-acetylglucosamine 2-epimerase (hydrolyzing) [Dorea sp.]|jgi:GDP/UDP-N,N'-diacetylbacillosamine 2-epimerase (hydrolysing)|nr:UDP-N-acetylglucosamine 2-epimerase (hydrolyzing) [Dorea sp.]
MKRIAIVTATRAEYGILTPLIRAVDADEQMELDLIVTGMHLSEKYGNTVSFIEEDGFLITHKIPILEQGNTPYDISLTMANAIEGFAKCFKENRPDMLVILGDRTEMLGIASAAMNERIPIAHIHGGEVTEGAVDDCVRHALTKMSYLHFTAAEVYRNRVIQLGENPDRVFNVGSLGTENIRNCSLMEEDEIRKSAKIPAEMPYAVVTFHPVTLEEETAELQTRELCKAMSGESDVFFLITMANADTGGDIVNKVLEEFALKHGNAKLVVNLGMRRYLSAVKYARYVLGNSSSGILEAPVLGTPTINIGDRQKGRLMAESVICCEPKEEDIKNAILTAERIEHQPSYLYGDGMTSDKIVRVLKDVLGVGIEMKKSFYDIQIGYHEKLDD